MPRYAGSNLIYGLTGWGGSILPIKIDPEIGVGALAINQQDQHTNLVFGPFLYLAGNVMTLASAASPGDYTVVVSAGHGLTGGEWIAIGTATEGYIGYVVSVAVNTLTMDRVINTDYAIGTQVEEINVDLAVNGSVTPIVSYTASLPAYDLDVTEMHIFINCSSQPDESLFGDLAALTNGVELYQLNGETGEINNLGTARRNGDMTLFTGVQTVYTDKGGAGSYTVLVRAEFRYAWGVTIRLRGTTSGVLTPGGRDELRMVIHDDLTGLDSMYILGIGHRVQ